jgi:hypothetical protein
MPSPRSKRPRSGRPTAGRWLPLLLVAACAGPPDRLATPPETARRDPYLIAPAIGYVETIDPVVAERLERAYRELMLGGSAGTALAVAQELRDHPGGGPVARVLAAQAYYAEGGCAEVVSQLESVVAEQPAYTAAQLLVGRCREQLGDLPGAATAYHSIATGNALAGARLTAIAPQARSVAVDRIRGWIAAGRIEEARQALDRMQQWAVADATTLSAVSELAGALGDRRLELEMVRRLARQGGAGRELLERQASLELDIGDAGAGLEILEELGRSHPDDPRLAERLDRARFAWRMTMLPDSVRELARSPELDRGQLAAMLYWVFPGVRYTRPAEPVIANDVLDHPHRTEIVRVVNLRLLAVDASLHAFRPGDPAERGDALGALLRILEAGGSGSCLGGSTLAPEMPFEATCELAARCGLLDEAADCLPEAVLSGDSALEMAQRAARDLERRGAGGR